MCIETKEDALLSEWLASPINDWTMEEELVCKFAETGADREMDFDLEAELINAYNKSQSK